MLASRTFFVLFAISLPAILRWCWGRGLARHLDDPALPERLQANQRRNVFVLVLSIAALIFWSGDNFFGFLAALVVARSAAGYALRKQLYNETWSMLAYLSFFTRLLLSVYGFWILLLMLPMVAAWFGPFDWAAGLTIGALLIAWNERATDVIRWCLRAKPIEDSALLPRFEQMAHVTCGDAPQFEYVDLGGGAVANAVALPCLRRSGVLFSSTLLALLDRDETIAICAHELAHLEYFTRKRLQNARLGNIGLIAMAVATAPIARVTAPSLASFAQVPLIAAIVAVMIWRAKDRQRNETASDLRAVALCGDGDALARALTKLYTFARLPRRWDAQRERQATHPSLARRIRDIRAANGVSPAPLSSAMTFAAAAGHTSVAFDEARLEWRESEGVSHSLSYAHLSELRLEARTSGPARLVAVERSGRRWEMTLAAADVGAVQGVLDSVDGRLSSVAAPRLGQGVVRIAALLAATASISFGQIAAAAVALLALARPAPGLLIAAGVGSVTASAMIVQQWLREPDPLSAWMAAIVAGAGLVFLVLARSTRSEDKPETLDTRSLVTLGAASALLLGLLSFDGVNAVRLHQNAVAMPGAAVMLLAFAAMLASHERRAMKLAAIAPAVLGVAVVGARSLTFLDTMGDPLLISAPQAAVDTIRFAASAEFTTRLSVGDLRLSPQGHAVILRRDDDEDEHVTDDESLFHVGPVGGQLQPVKADDVAFVDDDRVLTVRVSEGRAELREIEVANPSRTLWEDRVSGVASGTLHVHRDEWQLVGISRTRQVIRAAGRIGRAGAAITEWTALSGDYAWAAAMAAHGSSALLVDTLYDAAPFRKAWMYALYSATRSHSTSRVSHLTTGGSVKVVTSHLDVNCAAGALAQGGLACAAYDGARTRLLTLDAETGRIASVATLWGRFRAVTAGPGWITGWFNWSPAAIRIATGETLQFERRPDEWITTIAAAHDTIATAATKGGDSIIRIYRLPEHTAQR